MVKPSQQEIYKMLKHSKIRGKRISYEDIENIYNRLNKYHPEYYNTEQFITIVHETIESENKN